MLYTSLVLLTAELGMIRASSRPVLLLSPTRPRQPWYSSLVELSVVHAVRLPLIVFPLLQGIFMHPYSTMLRLHTLTLLGNRGKGFSAHAAGFLPQLVQPSMSLVEDRKWDAWCAERQIDPVFVSIGNLGDFLFNSKIVISAVSTVCPFKAAILCALSHRDRFLPLHSWGH